MNWQPETHGGGCNGKQAAVATVGQEKAPPGARVQPPPELAASGGRILDANVSVPPGKAGARTRAPAAPAGPRLGLSKAHISPPRGEEWTVRVWEGGALVELQGPGLKGSTSGGGGKRGKVGTFSAGSQQRMMRKLARLRTTVLAQFVGLTYPDDYAPCAQQWKRDLDTFFKRVRRQFPQAAAVWRLELEPRKSGTHRGELAPHYHLLLWGVPLAWEDASQRQLHWRFTLQSCDITNGKRLLKREVSDNGQWVRSEGFGLPGAGRVEVHSRQRQCKRRGQPVERETVEWWEFDGQPHLDRKLRNLGAHSVAGGRVELREWLSLVWYEIVGSADLCHLRAGTRVEQVRSRRGVMSYASKYIAKLEDTAPPVGRWWGVFREATLPWAEPVELALGDAQAIQLRRTARRYVEKQRRRQGKKKWQPRGACAWFCDATDWLRMIKALGEAPDPWNTAEIARRLADPRRRLAGPGAEAFTGCSEAAAQRILASAEAGWDAWRQPVSGSGFSYPP